MGMKSSKANRERTDQYMLKQVIIRRSKRWGIDKAVRYREVITGSSAQYHAENAI